jgi:hypothetical protein
MNEQIEETVGCGEDVLDAGYESFDAAAEAFGAAADGFQMRFGMQGPGLPGKGLRKIQPVTRTTSDGVQVTVEWEYPWAAGLIQHEDHSVEDVAEWVGSVLNNSRGWTRAGIWFPRVAPEGARAVFRYVWKDGTRCAEPSSVACTSFGVLPGGRHLVEIETTRFGPGFHKVVCHELAHAAFRAKHNVGTPYSGIMGNSAGGIWPTETDVQSVINWTRGEAIVV